MDYSSQNYNGCPSSRVQKVTSGNSASMRSGRTAPGCGCQNRTMARNIGRDWNEYPIGMAYVPWQSFRNLYSCEKGFYAGTMFQELDKPFMVGRCAR